MCNQSTVNVKMWLIRKYYHDLSEYFTGDDGRFTRMVGQGGKQFATAHPHGWAQHIQNNATDGVADAHGDEIADIYQQLRAWRLLDAPDSTEIEARSDHEPAVIQSVEREPLSKLEIAIYTNRHGHREYSLVLGYSAIGSGCVELLSDPFVEFPKASPDAMRPRVCWVTPVPVEHEGPGTRIYRYTGQNIPWQTPEIREILAAGPAAIEQRRSELYGKFYKSSYGQ